RIFRRRRAWKRRLDPRRGKHMIERYSRPEMTAIWADEHRIALMIEVEAVFLEVLAKEKKIPAAELKVLRAMQPKELIPKVKEQEKTSGHDVVALLQVMSAGLKEKAPSIHRYLHYGLTSSDVLDT